MPSHDGGEPRPFEKAVLSFDSRTRAVTRTAIAILVVLLAAWVARDFLVALIWAALIAITAWPIYIRFARLFFGNRSPTLAHCCLPLLTGLVLLAPIVLTAHQIAQGSDALVGALSQMRKSGISVPGLACAAAESPASTLISGGGPISANPEVLVEWLRGVNIENITAWNRHPRGALLHRLFLFFITLTALFLLLRDGRWLADRALATADRLLGNPGERLVSKIADATRATVNGTVATAIVKGAVIGMAYFLTGVPHPLLFVVLTMALAMVPLGAWVALVTAALILILHGALFAAAGLFGFGAAVLLIAENFIQPALIGGAARLPFLLVLIGIFGGMQSFGMVGLFLGPVIMAALLTIWREWIGVGD